MAARENQGLQIALIIFVLITIALFVSTFMFFSKYDEERAKNTEKAKAAETALTRAVEAEDQVKELKRLIGVPAGDALKAVQETHKKDFQTLGPGLAADQQDYRRLAQQLVKTLNEAQANLVTAQEREKKLNDKILADEAAKIAEIKQYTGVVGETAKDLDQERDKFNSDRTTATASKEELQRKLDAKRKEFDESVTKLKTEVQDLNSQIVKLSTQNVQLADRLAEKEADSELPDGLVSWVNQGERLVWLNLGSDDGLHQQTTFEVVDAGEPNPVASKSKASIEVTNVTDRHMAEARVVVDEPTNPIMPGDLIFSAAWQSNRKEHFAIAGFIDLNEDNESDRAMVKRIIALNNGVIDAEVTDDGKFEGELSVNTKFLIMGSKPTEKNLSPEMAKSFSRMVDQAQKLGIRQMGINKFLDYTGYRPQQKTVVLGKNARSSDFKPPVPDVPRKSIGKPHDYTPIRQKPKSTAY